MSKKKEKDYFPVHFELIRKKRFNGDSFSYIVKDKTTKWSGSMPSWLCRGETRLEDGSWLIFVREDHKYLSKMKLLTHEEREQLKSAKLPDRNLANV